MVDVTRSLIMNEWGYVWYVGMNDADLGFFFFFCNVYVYSVTSSF